MSSWSERVVASAECKARRSASAARARQFEICAFNLRSTALPPRPVPDYNLLNGRSGNSKVQAAARVCAKVNATSTKIGIYVIRIPGWNRAIGPLSLRICETCRDLVGASDRIPDDPGFRLELDRLGCP